MPELGDGRQREELRPDLASSGRTRRAATSGAVRAEADRRDVGIRACTRDGSCASSAVSSTPVEVEHDAVGSRSARARARSAPGPSRITRVYSWAGHSRADATCAASAQAADGTRAARAGTSSHWQSATARERSSRLRAARRGELAARHRSPASVSRRREPPARRRRSRPDATSASARSAGGTGRRRAPAIRSCRPSRRGSIGEPCVSHSLDPRNDKNQSDRSISSKTDNVQPACSWGFSPVPSTRARAGTPRASVVLPAPRSPASVTTMPPRRAPARRAPAASVAAASGSSRLRSTSSLGHRGTGGSSRTVAYARTHAAAAATPPPAPTRLGGARRGHRGAGAGARLREVGIADTDLADEEGACSTGSTPDGTARWIIWHGMGQPAHARRSSFPARCASSPRA